MSSLKKRGVRFANPDSDDDEAAPIPSDVVDDTGIDLAGTFSFEDSRAFQENPPQFISDSQGRYGGDALAPAGGSGPGPTRSKSTSAAAEEAANSSRKARPLSLMNDRRKEGWLTKQGLVRKNWKKRWFVLTTDYLYYFKGPDSKEAIGAIALDADTQVGSAETITKKPLSFQLFHPVRRTFFLLGANKGEMNDWSRAIDDVVAKLRADLKQEGSSASKLLNPSHGPHIVGKPLRQGYLEKKAEHKDKYGRRWFVVTATHLHQFKTFADPTPTASWALTSHLIETEEEKGRPVIILRSPEHTPVILAAPNVTERNSWYSALETAIGLKPVPGAVPGTAAGSKGGSTGSKRGGSKRAGKGGRSSKGSKGSRRRKDEAGVNKPPPSALLASKAFSEDEINTTVDGTEEDKVKVDVGTLSKKVTKGRSKPPFASTVARVHQGYMEKQGYIHRNWKKRFFVLSTTTLFYFKDPYDTEPRGTIALGGCSVGNAEEVTKKKHSIQIFHPDKRNYFFVCTSDEIRTEWITKIKEGIERANKNVTGYGAEDHTRSEREKAKAAAKGK